MGNVTLPGGTYEVPGLTSAQAAEINKILLQSGFTNENVQNIAPGTSPDGVHPVVVITLNNTGGPALLDVSGLSDAIVTVSNGSYVVTFDPGVFVGGNGNDNITFTGVGNDTVNTDHGNDTITLPNAGGNLTYYTKGNATVGGASSPPPGNDSIYIWGAGNVDLGNGNDTVVIKNYGPVSDSSTSSLTLGTGDHRIYFLGNGEINSAGNDTISLGTGNDTVVETGTSTTAIDSNGSSTFWHGYLYGAGTISQQNGDSGETVTGSGAFKIGQVTSGGVATGTELDHTGTGGGTIEFNNGGSHTYVFDHSQGGGRDNISGFVSGTDHIDLTNYTGDWNHQLILGSNGDHYIKLNDGTVIEIHGTIALSDVTGG